MLIMALNYFYPKIFIHILLGMSENTYRKILEAELEY